MIQTLKPKITCLILDMDGVIWRSDQPIGNLPRLFTEINDLGLKFAFVTNNSCLDASQFIDKLDRMGVKSSSEQVITSSMAVAQLLSKQFPGGGPVYIIGEIGLYNTLKEYGYYHDDRKPQGVIVGMDRQVTYQEISTASLLIRNGVPFYATNDDKTYPTRRGLEPGAGAILAAIETATNVRPIVAGKPNSTVIELALDRLSSQNNQALMIGDRLETDILAGQRAGTRTALVLSGASTRADLQKWSPKPDLTAENLSQLLNISDNG